MNFVHTWPTATGDQVWRAVRASPGTFRRPACHMALGVSTFLRRPRHARAVAGGLSTTFLNLRAGVAAVSIRA
jgi:hypothetical protein